MSFVSLFLCSCDSHILSSPPLFLSSSLAAWLLWRSGGGTGGRPGNPVTHSPASDRCCGFVIGWRYFYRKESEWETGESVVDGEWEAESQLPADSHWPTFRWSTLLVTQPLITVTLHKSEDILRWCCTRCSFPFVPPGGDSRPPWKGHLLRLGWPLK